LITVSNLDIYPLDLLSASGAHHEEGQLRLRGSLVPRPNAQ